MKMDFSGITQAALLQRDVQALMDSCDEDGLEAFSLYCAGYIARWKKYPPYEGWRFDSWEVIV